MCRQHQTWGEEIWTKLVETHYVAPEARSWRTRIGIKLANNMIWTAGPLDKDILTTQKGDLTDRNGHFFGGIYIIYILYYIILYCIVLYYMIWYYIILYDIISYYIILYYILCYIILYYIILYYIILYSIYYIIYFIIYISFKKTIDSAPHSLLPGLWCLRSQGQTGSRGVQADVSTYTTSDKGYITFWFRYIYIYIYI